MSSETAQVRPSEELDLDALSAYLRAALPSSATNDEGDAKSRLEVRQFPGGHSNLTYLIRFNGDEFVLRRPPMGPVAPTAHDMPREYKLLNAVHPSFPLAPKPVLLCEDASVVGAPFYLMERKRGLIVRHRVPPEIGDDVNMRRRVSESVVDTLVALHAVDIHATGIVQIGKPLGFVARQVRGWTERWQRSKTSEVPEMEAVSRWLNERIPVETDVTAATLVHNDFKLDNVMLEREDPARVVAVLDWEMCTVGDPLIDVGLFICYWTLKDEEENSGESLSAVTHGEGWMTRGEIIERYAQKTGRDLSHIKFYETFALFKVAVILQQIYFRFARGQTRDERFKSFDRRVLNLARAAHELSRHSNI
ncbi:MAG: phosphotransferase family protein [Pyrinomonadaceae bacterium]|nr:phosphotransferase family protein [Pyrinomonadaceae bacterium]